jgi:hypothetical protein
MIDLARKVAAYPVVAYIVLRRHYPRFGLDLLQPWAKEDIFEMREIAAVYWSEL